MKKNLFRIFYIGLFSLITFNGLFAQDDSTLTSAAGDLYVISAQAGGVNFIQGRVTVRRADGESGYLVKGDKLEIGDKVSTSSDSRAEILLNPGSFIRIDNNSEFEFVTTSLDDLKIQVNRGSAIFEVFASDDFKVTVSTPKAGFYLVDTGVYRVDVLSNGIGQLEVQRGKAQIASSSAEKLKKGLKATVDENNVALAKFDRDDEDSFESWSKDRAKLIAKVNKKLAADRLSDTLLDAGRRYDCYNTFGLWVYSPRYQSYSFLPYGFGWRTPYGYGLRTSTEICSNPFYDNYWRRPTYITPRGGGNGGGTSTTTVPQANIDRANRNSTPPFRRIENSGNVQMRRTTTRGDFPGFPPPGRSTSGSSETRTTKTTTTVQSERTEKTTSSKGTSRKKN